MVNWTRMVLSSLVVTLALSGAVAVLDDGSAAEPAADTTGYGDVVTYYVSANDDVRALGGAVDAGVAYWEQPAGDALDGAVVVERVSDRDRADIVIELRERVSAADCDLHADAGINGCAPIGQPSDGTTARVLVEATQPWQAVRDTVSHEVGHALGLTHDAAAAEPVMRPRLPAVHERAELRVAFAPNATADRSAVAPALDYLSSDPGTALTTVRLAEERRDADLVVERVPGDELRAGWVVEARPTDSGQLRLRIAASLDSEAVAWYTAATLGDLYYDEVPAELSADTPRDERRDWP